jgi:hypothetical protein
MQRNLIIRIADVSIAIEGYGDWDIVAAYRPFVSSGNSDICLRLHQGTPDISGRKKVFDCPPVWTLYRQNGTSLINIFSKLRGLGRTLVLPPHLDEAHLYFPVESDLFVDPFFGPTLELMMLKYLAKRRGVIIHGCGIVRDGKGALFAGESGAGKSTLARLWAPENGVEVLSDDRTIVRKQRGEFWMYGTPWHGDAEFGSPRGVRLESIFFLRHGRTNSVEEMTGSDPVSQLLTCSFPALWDPQGMEFVLELFADLTARVPCHELSFKPDNSVIEFFDGMTE